MKNIKKTILGLVFTATAIGGLSSLKQRDPVATAAATNPGYFGSKLDADGFVNHNLVKDANTWYQTGSESWQKDLYDRPYNVKNNDNFFRQMCEKGMLDSVDFGYVKSGVEYKYEYDHVEQSINSKYYFTSFYDLPSEDFVGHTNPVHVTLIESVYDSEVFIKSELAYISFYFEMLFDKKENDSPGVGNSLFRYLMPLITGSVSLPLLTINNQPVLSIEKDEDDVVSLKQHQAYAYFSPNYTKVYIDWPNVGHIERISIFSLQPINHIGNTPLDQVDGAAINAPFTLVETVNNNLYLTSLLPDWFDPLNALVEFKLSKNYILSGETVSDITIEGKKYTTTEIARPNGNVIRFKINNYTFNYKNKIMGITAFTLNYNGSLWTIEDRFNYLYNDTSTWHRMYIATHLTHWLDYTNIYFSVRDNKTEEWIRRNLTHITFTYYEGRKDFNNDKTGLAKNVTFDDEEQLKALNNKYPSIFSLGSGIASASQTWFGDDKVGNKVEFKDKHDRYWKMHRTNLEDDIASIFSNFKTYDFVLYTSRPGNWVYDVEFVYIHYKNEAGDTIKLSAYEDALHTSVDANGNVIIIDNKGVVHEDKTVSEEGIILKDGERVDVDNDKSDSWLEDAINGIGKAIGDSFGSMWSSIRTSMAIAGVAIIVILILRRKK